MPVDNNGSHVNKGSIHFLLNRDDIPPSREQTPTTTTADEFRAIPRSHNTFHTPAHLPDSTTGRGNVLLLREEITEQRTTTTVTRRSVYAQPAPASTGDNFSYNAQGGPLAAAGSGPAYPTGSGGSAGGALPPALTLTPTPHQQPRSSNKGKGPKQGSVLIVPNTYNAGPASSSGADAAQQTDEPEDKAARKRKRNAERQRKCREKKKEIFVLDLPDKIVMATPEQITDPNIRKVSLYTQQTRVRDRKRVLENGTIATPEDIATGKKTTSYTAFCKRAKASTQDAQPLSSHTEHTNNNSGTANSTGAGAGPAIVPNTYNAGPASSSSGADAAQQTDEPEDKAARKRKRNAERQRKCREKKKEIFVLDLPDKIVMATLEQIADPNIRKVSLYTQQTRVRDRKRVLENGTIATPEDIATGKKTTSYAAFCKRAKASTQDAQPLSSHTEHTNNNSGTANSAGAGAGPANATRSNRTPLEYTGSAAAIVRRFASPSPSLSDSSSLQQHDTPGTHSYQSTRTIDSDDVPLAKRRKR